MLCASAFCFRKACFCGTSKYMKKDPIAYNSRPKLRQSIHQWVTHAIPTAFLYFFCFYLYGPPEPAVLILWVKIGFLHYYLHNFSAIISSWIRSLEVYFFVMFSCDHWNMRDERYSRFQISPPFSYHSCPLEFCITSFVKEEFSFTFWFCCF